MITITQANDTIAIQDIFASQAVAWNHEDWDAFADCFTEDADYVTFNGMHLKGRQDIADSHRMLFSGVLRGSKLEGDITAMRFLTSDMVIVHQVGAVKLRWQKNAPKGRQSINTNVVVKYNGEWKVASFHNCRVKGPNIIEKLLMNS